MCERFNGRTINAVGERARLEGFARSRAKLPGVIQWRRAELFMHYTHWIRTID